MNLKSQNNKKNALLLTVFLYLALLFCFQPKLFVKYTIPNAIYVVGLLIAFVGILLFYWVKRKTFSTIFYLLVFYRASFFIQTILSKGDILMWGYMSIALMTLCLLIDYFVSYNAKLLLNAIINILTFLLTVNLIIGFLFPNGIIDELYFIGIRTRLTDITFPLLACTLINLFSRNKDNNSLKQKLVYVKTIYIFVLSILTIFYFHIATAFVGLAIFVFSFFIFLKIKKLRNVLFILVAGLLVNYLVVFLNITQYFEWFISGILGKSMTLSGRTEIWEIAINIVKNKLLFGYGMADNGGFVYWGYTGGPLSYWQAHNQWLQLLYDGGLFTLFLFVFLIVYSCKKIKYTDKKLSSIILACMSAFVIMMISEIYSYTPYFFLIIFLAPHLKFFKENDSYSVQIPASAIHTPEPFNLESIPETIKISLCMCTYNGAQYIREQLDSIVNQTKLPSEIIVFDDASTDDTVAILSEYKTAYPQIHWDIRVNEKNAGWRVNFKNCLEQASGDVIFLADQDDIWMSDKLAVMTRALLQKPEIEVLVSDYTPFYMDGSIDHGIEVETEGTKTVSPLPANKNFLHCARPGCTFALKKEALVDFFACWQPHFAHDATFWRTTALKGTLYRIDYSSILFRRHSSNASSNQNRRISAAERNSEQKVLYLYRDCIETLKTLPLSTKNVATLAKVSKWNEKRIALYEKPTIWKWIGLCVNISYYPWIKAYLKDLNAVLYKG